MSRKRQTRAPKRSGITVVLDQETIDSLDVVAEETEATRSYVIEEMVKYCLQKESVLDELFPPAEDGDSEEEDEGEEPQSEGS